MVYITIMLVYLHLVLSFRTSTLFFFWRADTYWGKNLQGKFSVWLHIKQLNKVSLSYSFAYDPANIKLAARLLMLESAQKLQSFLVHREKYYM